ncbi:EamA family transporter [Taibaiella soli]|uniref:EamA/RhaT family transporter n=1 Tax=Taibaiella soli TaxID=1649169 RepID=A0A2W2AYN5_9BACT|nr:DMT family transporter [Taibaiella soli]PZF72768.1 EamA/RhaT family transporter [Taibaiella soli]
MNTNRIKGSLLIAAAACCYGMLGTFVKLAYLDGFTTAEITVAQFSIGFLSLLLLSSGTRNDVIDLGKKRTGRKDYLKVVAAGSSLGLTSISYYMAVKYIAVSLGIVLLLQAVWMSVVLECILNKKRRRIMQIVAVLLIFFGTILATGTLQHTSAINWTGIGWGLFAAVCYTATMYSSSHLQLQLPPMKRSFLMVTGGFVIVLVFFAPELIRGFSFKIFLTWGILVSLFGTVLPPILFTRGMPLTGMGLGAMLTSLEVPVAILFAHFLLGESISLLQWSGVIFILVAIILINRRKLNANANKN